MKTTEERVLLERELRKALSELLLNSASKLRKTSHVVGDLYLNETDPKLKTKWFRLGLICETLEKQQIRNTKLLQDGGAFALTYEAPKQLPANEPPGKKT